MGTPSVAGHDSDGSEYSKPGRGAGAVDTAPFELEGSETALVGYMLGRNIPLEAVSLVSAGAADSVGGLGAQLAGLRSAPEAGEDEGPHLSSCDTCKTTRRTFRLQCKIANNGDQ